MSLRASAKSDLRELKLTLGECRQLINQLGATNSSKRRMQLPTGSSARGPQQVEVTVTQPEKVHGHI